MTLQKQEAQIEEVRVINSDPPPHLYSLPFPYIRSCGLVYPACVYLAVCLCADSSSLSGTKWTSIGSSCVSCLTLPWVSEGVVAP
jgi:hypothetical protein